MSRKKRDEIMKLITDKGTASIAVFEKSKEVFLQLKSVLEEIEKDVKQKISVSDPRVAVEFEDKGRLEVHFKFADDVLVFLMHTKVFAFDPAHPQMKSSYVREDPLRGFCGMIYVYNFLYESVKFNRREDYGLLVARMFINAEGHFFVEGKRRISTLFNDFAGEVADREKLTRLVEELMVFVLEIDMKAPPYDAMQQTTLQNIIDSSPNAGIVSGKRFGFMLPGSDDGG